MKIICEAGCNFKDLGEAKLFIDKSKELGLFATKFQLYNEELIKEHKEYRFLSSIQLSWGSACELFEYGKEIGQEVFFSCMFEEAIDWCNSLNIKYCKIRHKDQYNYSLLWKAFLSNMICFISTDYFIPFRTNFIPFFCIPKYPASIKDYQLPKNVFYQGISDHTSNLQLLKNIIQEKRLNYFEKHMKLNDDCLESEWSVTFEELAEVLNHD